MLYNCMLNLRMYKKQFLFLRFIAIMGIIIVLIPSCNTDDNPPTVIVEKNDETYSPAKVKAIMDVWQKKTFDFFYTGASSTGLAYEGNDRGDVVTIGGSGFGVMSIVVGADRNYITRDQAAAQIRNIVIFLGKAQRFKGAWSHWYNPDGTAHAFGDQVQTGDLVETAFMMAGLLVAKEYFNQSTSIEKEIRDSVDSFWGTVDWRFYAGNGDALNWLYYSESNQLSMPIKGWNEGLITYILALGAPEPHNISADVYRSGWLSSGGIFNYNRQYYGYKLPFGEAYGGPLFFAHYSFLGLNPKLMEDDYASYWQQNVSHTMINRHYCIYAAPTKYKYGESDWGLTACYGGRPPWGYMARSPLNDDGVLAPTAALSSYPYTPFYSTQVLMHLSEYSLAQGTYGFADAYSPETLTSEKKHLAIDQGPIVVMMENYRSGLIWNLLMNNDGVKKGLQLAGMKSEPNYSEGFYLANINTQTNEYDMMRHPDRGTFELDYFLNTAGNVSVMIKNAKDTVVMDTTVVSVAGENVFKFKNTKTILNGKQYIIKMSTQANNNYELTVRLH